MPPPPSPALPPPMFFKFNPFLIISKVLFQNEINVDVFFHYRANVPSDPRAAQMKVACMKMYQGIADMNIVETQDPQCPDVWK